jgi:hypothetical protein
MHGQLFKVIVRTVLGKYSMWQVQWKIQSWIVDVNIAN